jgi:hypothetical protein
MVPADLKSESFHGYAPEAQKLAVEYLGALRRLPLAFLSGLLREIIDYDFRFPAERKTIERELSNLNSLSAAQTKDWFEGFAEVQLSSKLEQFDWVNAPAQFLEQLSAHLWTTHQLDRFRAAALAYAERLREAVPPEAPVVPRLGIAVIGAGADAAPEPLFRKLRSHGAYFTNVQPENGMSDLLEAIAARANAHPLPYGHWYIDGGQELPHPSGITFVSYQGLEPARTALLRRIQQETKKAGMGPEALRTIMAQMQPVDLGMSASEDPVLDRFKTKVLTEGSGTQIFSTSFAQWTAREAWRRAQPVTVLVRFAPRQRQKPMNELLLPNSQSPELDPVGSLMDADMGAYYNWLNQQRLSGSTQSMFIAWFENHNEAVAISPLLPRGTESSAAAKLPQLLSWMS